MRALLVGIENYAQFGGKKRPGSLNALREIEQRLKDGGWHTRLLTEDASTSNQKAGLTQLLEGVDWLSGCDQSMLILSGMVQDGRFYPCDAKASFVNQSTLKLKDLITALPKETGVIIDGPADSATLEPLTWALVAQTDEDQEEMMFSTYGPTSFLHSLTIALNTWPLNTTLKVREFFDHIKLQDAPPSLYHNYSSLQSVTLLSAFGDEFDAQTMITAPKVGGESNTNDASNQSGSSIDETIASQSSMPRGGRFISKGRFQLLRLLGEGGIGQVFLATDTQLNKKRAVKLLKIPEQLSDSQREHIQGRMIQSAKAAQELSEYSHNVVQVYDIGIDEDTEMPFMVMEYLQGMTLNERLYKSPVLNLDQIFDIGLTLCETLAVAHQQNVVHRDLKPDNIMLINRGGTDLFVKLLDFDLVKVESGEVKTQEGQILGTLEYMAPEQLKGQEIDVRADVFALGAILYECFSGIRANPGKTQRELVRLLLDHGVKPLEEVAPHLPKDLCQLINSCLSLSVGDRPQDAQELAQRLRPLQRYQPALSSISFGIDPLGSTLPYDTPNTLAADEEQSLESLPLLDVAEVHHESSFTADPQNVISSDPKKIQNSSIQHTHGLQEEATLSGVNSSVNIVKYTLVLLAGVLVAVVLMQQLKPSQPSVNVQVDLKEDPSRQAKITAEQSTPIVTLTNLEDLRLLPVPSTEWPDLIKVSTETLAQGGSYRIYEGGRFEERLAYLSYELHFRWKEGDPPIKSWLENEKLRYQLLKRSSLIHLKESPRKLYISNNLFIELLAQRPQQKKLTGLGNVLSFTDGLMVLEVKNKRNRICKSLAAGDVIREISWVVRGKKSLNGRCENENCIGAYDKAHRRKNSEKLRLTLGIERAMKENGAWQSKELKVKCVL